MAALVLADADSFWIVAIGAEWTRAACADPFVSAFVALLLLAQPLRERFHQLFPSAQRLYLRFFFIGEVFLGQRTEPFFRNEAFDRITRVVEALEYMAEDAVELVD